MALDYAVGSYSGCTGGAWVASKEWNLGEINRCFMNWYGSLEGTWFGKCSKVFNILRLYERKTFKNASGVKLIGISLEFNELKNYEVHYEACLRGALNKGLFKEVQGL